MIGAGIKMLIINIIVLLLYIVYGYINVTSAIANGNMQIR